VSTPATAPTRTAEPALTKAHGAVMATRPARRPLQIIVTSGFPKRSQTNTHAKRAPDADASIVFVAITEMRTSELARVDPGLKPNHPKARTSVPVTTIGTL